MAKQARNPTPAKAPKMKIKKGDRVVVVAGKDRGREGQVIAAYPTRQKVVVEGVNMIKKNTKVTHQGPRGSKQGGIVTQEAPLDVSNVQIVDPDTKAPARLGYRLDDAGNKIRITRPGGKDI
jgi:large subunit ribosomal protein L24